MSRQAICGTRCLRSALTIGPWMLDSTKMAASGSTHCTKMVASASIHCANLQPFRFQIFFVLTLVKLILYAVKQLCSKGQSSIFVQVLRDNIQGSPPSFDHYAAAFIKTLKARQIPTIRIVSKQAFSHALLLLSCTLHRMILRFIVRFESRKSMSYCGELACSKL